MDKPGTSSDGKKETKKSSDPTSPSRKKGKESELKPKLTTPIIEIHPSTPKQASEEEECFSPETAEPSTSKMPEYGSGLSPSAMELDVTKPSLSPVSPQQMEEGSMSSKLSLSPSSQIMEESPPSKLSISPPKQMEEESTSQKSISPPSPKLSVPSQTSPQTEESTSRKSSPSPTTPKRAFPSSISTQKEEEPKRMKQSPTLPKKKESTSPKQSTSPTTPKRSLPPSTTLVEEEPTTPRKLKKVEALQHLESAPTTSKQVESAPATPKQMESAPATPKQMESAPATPKQMESAPATPKQMESAPATPKQMESAPATPKQMESAPATPKQMESAPATPKQMESAPATPKQMESAPATPKQMESAPATPKQMESAPATPKQMESAPATPKQMESAPATPKQMESAPATPKQMEQESEVLSRKEAPSSSKKSSSLSSSPEGTSASRTEILKASTSKKSSFLPPSAEGTSASSKESLKASTSAHSPSAEGTSTSIEELLAASTSIEELLEASTSKRSEKNPTLAGKSRTKEEGDSPSTPPSRYDKSWEAEMSPGSPFDKVSSYLSKRRSSKSKERTDSSSETSVETLLTLEAIPEEEEITQKKTPELRDEEWWKKKVAIFWDIIDIIYRINKKRNHVQKVEDPCCRIYSDLDYKTINLCAEILDAVNEMKFLHPSFIQKAGLKCFLGRNRDILVQSPRWSGKTSLMIMACLRKVDFSKKYPQIIMLNPLKEEAMKTLAMAKDLAKYFRRAAFFLAVGDQSDEKPDDKHMVIGIPSEVLDLASRKELIDVTKIKVIAFDDLHNMPPSEYNAALNLSSLVPEFCSRMTLSIPAFTMDLGILEKGRKFVKSPVELEICGLQDVVHFRFLCHNKHDKATFISKTLKLFTNKWKFAVFCSDPIEWFQRIPFLFEKACVLPKDMTEEDMKRKLNIFRNNPTVMCVFAQRSRFLPTVGYWVRTVFNVDLPIDANGDLDVEEYFNRAGRIERIGMVINLSEQQYDEKLRVISNYTKKEILAL